MNWDELIEEADWKKRKDLPRYLRDIADSNLYIYGAGCFGRELLNVFARYGIPVKGFLDRNAKTCDSAEIPILLPEELTNREDVVLVLGIVLNFAERVELENRLRNMGYRRFVDGQSIRAHYVYALEDEGERHPRKYYEDALAEIASAEKLFEDEESRRTYEKNLSAHLLRNYSNCQQTLQMKQYFIDDVPFSKGYSHFVDCGAYIGDTLQSLCEVFGNIEEVVAFEPDMENFSTLSQNYESKLKQRIHRGILFPCGVFDTTTMQTFTRAGGSSAITENGEKQVLCVSMDEVLKGFTPTFIKMDIEGAEFAALEGAKRLICEHQPDLAISVYHIVDDFWRIPLLIHSWEQGYRFYLRTHSSCCMETILYAVC